MATRQGRAGAATKKPGPPKGQGGRPKVPLALHTDILLLAFMGAALIPRVHQLITVVGSKDRPANPPNLFDAATFAVVASRHGGEAVVTRTFNGVTAVMTSHDINDQNRAFDEDDNRKTDKEARSLRKTYLAYEQSEPATLRSLAESAADAIRYACLMGVSGQPIDAFPPRFHNVVESVVGFSLTGEQAQRAREELRLMMARIRDLMHISASKAQGQLSDNK